MVRVYLQIVTYDRIDNKLLYTALSFAKECVKRVVFNADSRIGRHKSIGLNAVLETVQFPACIADLNACLTDMYTDYFTLQINR